MFEAKNRVEVDQTETKVMMVNESFDKPWANKGVLNSIITLVIQNTTKPAR